jgi:hypothetical protein
VLRMDATSAPIKLVLEPSGDADPIAGRLYLDDRDALAFSGYLELISRLEEIRRSQRPRNPRGDVRVSKPSPKPSE